MKLREINELSAAELAVKEKELADEIFQTRLKFLSGELANTSKIKTDRRDFARVKTLLALKRQSEAK